MPSILPRAVGAAALGWLAWRAFGPEPSPRFVGDQDIPLRMPGRTVLVGRNEFFVREAGPPDAPPVVLLHGWLYDSLGTWHPVVERLAARHRIIAVDQRNHGRADRIRGRYSVDQVADEVVATLDAIGVASFSAVGYSMGGMVAQAIVRRHPGRVDRMVLAATAAHPIPVRRVGARVIFGIGRAVGRLSPYEGSRVSWAYLTRTGAVAPEYGRWLWELLLNRDMNLYFEGGYAILRFDSRAWVGRLDVPALVVIPTEDQLIPAMAQYELASLLQDVETLELVGARHEAVLTHTDDFVTAVEAFLA